MAQTKGEFGSSSHYEVKTLHTAAGVNLRFRHLAIESYDPRDEFQISWLASSTESEPSSFGIDGTWYVGIAQPCSVNTEETAHGCRAGGRG